MIYALSLFDGKSTGRYCLEQAGYQIGQYFSSEIDKTAITISQDNYPDNIRLGDVTKISYVNGQLITENGIFDAPRIDIIFSGSPCQDISSANPNKKGIHGPKSKLFFEFIRILEEVRQANPNVKFLQENVAKGVAPADIAEISRALNIFPVRIDSKLVSAQLRDRYYWTDISVKKVGLFNERYTDIPQPKDRGIFLQDILEPGTYTEKNKANAILASDSRPITDKKKLFRRYKNGFGTVVFDEPYLSLKGYELGPENCRILTQTELERCQTLPDGYTKSVNRNKAAHALGNGWTAEVFIHILKHGKIL